MKRLAAACIAALATQAAWSASGEFTFVVGDVKLVKANGQSSQAARGTPVDSGEDPACPKSGSIHAA